MCLAPNTPTNMSTTSSETKPKKVTFGGIMGTCEAPQNYRITKTQKALLWYNKTDLQEFRNGLKQVLRNGNQIDESDCFRGIEAYVNRIRSKTNKANTAAVLRMQAENDFMGVSDPIGLRAYSVCLSRCSTRAGILRASQDAVEAYQTHQESSSTKIDFVLKQTLTGFMGQRSRPAMARSA
jgi:hypothetical protein